MNLHIKINSPKGKSWEFGGLHHLAINPTGNGVQLLFRLAKWSPDGWENMQMCRGSEITIKIREEEEN